MKKQSFTIVLQNRCSKKFRKFHWKTPALEFFFKKVVGPQVSNFIKKRFQHRRFPVKFAKILRTCSSAEHLQRLHFKTSNSKIVKRLFKDFSEISLTHNKSHITCNPHYDKLI